MCGPDAWHDKRHRGVRGLRSLILTGFSDCQQTSQRPHLHNCIICLYAGQKIASTVSCTGTCTRNACAVYKLCMLVHRCLHGETPSYLAYLVVPTSIASNRAGLRSAQSLSVAVPRTHSTLGDRAFSVAAPLAWNNFPPHIRHISSTDVFSKSLKSFLFSCAF